MKSQNKAYLYALGAVLLWSTVATAFEISLESVSFISLLFYSSLTAFITLGIILKIEGQWIPIKNLKKSTFLFGALRGFLNPFLYYLILLKAYSILPAQEAMSLNYIWPLMLVLLSVPILGQRIGIIGLLAVVISFFGVIMIATHGQITSLKFENPFGAFLALSSSIIWALFWLANMRSKEQETLKLFISFGFGVIFSGILLAFTDGFGVPSVESVFSMVYVGLAEMGIAFFLWIRALSLTDRTDKVSKLIYLSPFLSLFIISIVLGEKIGTYTIVGLALIILGISINDRKKPLAKIKEV